MKNLYLLIDNSESMWELDYDSNRKKIDLLKDRLLTFLENNINYFENIYLYEFASSLQFLGTFRDINAVKNALIVINRTDSNTKLWDSINAVIETIMNPNGSITRQIIMGSASDNLILCVTDGEDNASLTSYDDLVKKLNETNNIELRIIDLSGKLNKTKSTTKSKIDINHNLNNISNVLAYKTSNETLSFSVAVIPIIRVSDIEKRLVKNSLIKAIPYIEELTGLRYYPAPTFIVDEYELSENSILRDIDDRNNQAILTLIDDLKELSRFVLAVSISFHTAAFLPSKIKEILKETEYQGFHNLSEEEFRRFKMLAESGYNAFYLTIEKWKEFFSNQTFRIFFPEISSINNPIINFHDDLKYLLGIFKRIIDNYEEAELSKEYFIGRDKPDLNKWKKYTSKNQFLTIRECIDENGLWKKDLKHIIAAMEITINLIYDLLIELKRDASEFRPISSNIHAFGVYFPATENINLQLREKFRQNEFPPYSLPTETGMVLICLKEIKKRIEETLRGNNSLNKEALKEDLILATVVHEHTHAAIFEGINIGDNNTAFTFKQSSGKKFKAVSD